MLLTAFAGIPSVDPLGGFTEITGIAVTKGFGNVLQGT